MDGSLNAMNPSKETTLLKLNSVHCVGFPLRQGGFQVTEINHRIYTITPIILDKIRIGGVKHFVGLGPRANHYSNHR